MSIQVYDPNGSLIYFKPGVPDEYRGPLIAGGQFLHAQYNSGNVLLQQVQGDGFSLHYWIHQYFQRFSLKVRSVKEGLYARLLLKNSIHHKVKGAGRLSIRQGQYSVLWSHRAECESRYEAGEEYHILDLYFSVELVQQLSEFYPELQTLTETEARHPVFLGQKVRWIPATLQAIVRDLLYCELSTRYSGFYLELKVREFLLLLLNDVYNGNAHTKIKISAADQQRLEQLRTILQEHVSKKLPTLRQLSQQISLNEFKIKKGFRELYGTGITEYLTNLRMEKARMLLLNSDLPIKAICIEAGYPRLSNFITAFRRKFGYTPGSLRRK